MTIKDDPTDDEAKRHRPGAPSRARPTRVHVQLRLTPEQAKVYQSIGQTEWLRKMLDHVGDVAYRWGIDLESLAPTPETIPEKTATPEGYLLWGFRPTRCPLSPRVAACERPDRRRDAQLRRTETINLMHRIAQSRRDLFRL